MNVLEQFGRFLLGGALGAIVYFGAFFLLTRVGKVQYKLPIVVIVISVLNAAMNFVIQKFWAFQDKEVQNISQQFTLYLVWCVVYSTINAWLVDVLVRRWRLKDWVALIVARVALGIASFLITRSIFPH